MFGDILLLPILGAIIGFSTNVLAILMLFRPHRPLRFGGFTVPFTPGLIPKGKRQMAAQVGLVLGESALTPKALAAALSETAAVEGIALAVSKHLEALLDDDRAVGQLIAPIAGIAQDELHGQLMKMGHAAIDLATDGIDLPSTLPPFLVAHVEDFLRGKIGDVPQLIRAIINHEQHGVFLRQAVTKIIKENTKGLVALFTNPDKIYDSLTASLVDYLESENGQAALHQHLDRLVEVVVDWPLPQDATKWAHGAIVAIANHIKQGDLMSRAVSGLLALTPAQIITPEAKQHILGMVRPLVASLITRAGEMVADSIDIPRVVEAKINEMDTRDAERIILSVAGKQLRWIAALGGVIGFAIGFIPVVFS